MTRAVFLTAFAAVVLGASKMETVRVEIAGGNLRAPIVITDSAVTREIKVWAGPGHFRMTGNVREPIPFAQGFIVDWSRGPAVPPAGLTTYDVAFVTTRRDPSTYVVRYAIDAATGHGYVYFPAKGERGYEDNVFLILRGVEGGWFHAWSKWEEVAHPLIREALR